MATDLESSNVSRIDGALTVNVGRLWIEECEVAALAREFGTPLYVMSADQVRRNLARLQAAFAADWPGRLQVLPSIKANASLAIRRILTAEGTGCDAFGPGELEAALRGGVPPDRISLNGPSKDAELLERAISLGVRITLDSVLELDRAGQIARRLGRPAHARLRVRPNYSALQRRSQMMPNYSIHEAAARYKAGIPTEDLLALTPDRLQPPGVLITGLMAHLGRHDAEPETWAAMATAFVEVIGELLRTFPFLNIQEIDIGGGMPAPRDPFGRADESRGPDTIHPRVPPPETFAAAIVPTIRNGIRGLGLDPTGVTLEIEPGRSLFADAGVHLTTVVHVKRETQPFEHTWVETDTSDAWLADTILERNRWSTLVANRVDSPSTERVQLVGRTCAPDTIVADVMLPTVEAGDVIAILDTGAYQEACASNFNSLPRPASVLVCGSSAALIRRAETFDDVFARELIPAPLIGPDESVAVNGVDHVSVTTANIERSLAFYCDVLGLPLRARGEERGGEVAQIVGVPDVHVRWADLRLPDNCILELIEYVDRRDEAVDRGSRAPGTTHFALRVQNARAAYRRLVSAGLPVRSEPVALTESGDWRGARCFYATDPDGVTIELIERPRVATPRMTSEVLEDRSERPASRD